MLKKRTPDTPGIKTPPAPTRQVPKQQDAVTESLEAIYDGKPSKESFKKFDHRERKTWIMIAVTIVVLSALSASLAWLGFWWFGSRGFSGTGLVIQIEGPKQVSVGEEITYFINWHNKTNEPLASTEFRISFPNDFQMSNVEPEPTAPPLLFRLGSQAREARGTFKVTGTFTGALGTKSAIQVIGTYRPASFPSEFEELMTHEVAYTDTVLKGNLEAPAKALPGDEIDFVYRLKNTGKQELSGLEARIELPPGFILSATSTDARVEGRIYIESIGLLASDEEKAIRLTGAFSLGSGGDVHIVASAGRIAFDGTFASSQTTEAPISVLAGDLAITLVMNGSQNNRTVPLGERQRVAISYENLSGEELSGITLSFVLEPEDKDAELIAWNELEDSLDGDLEKNRVTFTSTEIESFEKLPARGEGLIELSIPFVHSLHSEPDVPVRAYVEATIDKIAEESVRRTFTTEPITFRLQSDAALTSIARYTAEEGVAVGSGPLPPLVGQKTTYRVEWSINKTIHELERVKVSAKLPSGVEWGSVIEVGAGTVGYDPDLRLVTWSLNSLPADIDDVLISFDLGLVPSEADAGRFGKLLGETRFEFKDFELEEPILRTSSALTTDLPHDTIAKGKGVVDKP